MQISIARNNDTGQILVRLEAETFAEILLLGRWTGHIEAAGQPANYTVVETNAPAPPTPSHRERHRKETRYEADG